ncbi:MAG: hypothetical protein R2932_55350 [Caldilineaceae bacterium]
MPRYSIAIGPNAPAALLTVAQEAALYDQVQRGVAASWQLEQDPNRAEAPLLRAQITAGKAAAQQLYRANARIVVSIVKRYAGRGLDMTTLIAHGNQGVLRAIEDRRSYSGFYEAKRFTGVIRQTINEAIRRQRLS